jgi:hypothetical protein
MMTPEEIAAKAAADEKAAAEVKAGESNKETKMVPEWQLLEAKAAAQKKIDDLTAKIAEGAPAKEVSADLDEIYKQYPDVDKKFIDVILAKATAAAEAKVEPIVKAEKAKEHQAEIDSNFEKNYKIAMDKLGKDFDGIVNKDAIKALTLLKSNANKTFSEIIEETYGGALTGKRTIDTTTPAGGKDPQPLNFDKARKDSKYFDEVMDDPALKAQYNAEMLKRGF